MKKIKYLNEWEKKELFKAIRQDTRKNATRNLAIFLVAKYCALRVSEIHMIRIDDYNPGLSQIYCRREKGSNNNTLRIVDPTVKNALDAYFAERLQISSDNQALFLSSHKKPISRQQLDVLFKQYSSFTSIALDKRHFHVLKHTRAIELADMGVNVQDIQWWLGHKKINNTLIYMQFTTKQQEQLYLYLAKQETT